MIDRRTIITAALAAIASPVASRSAMAQGAVSRITAYAFSFPALAGGDIRLAEYAGRPLLVVNTASLCGFTPQYAGLQEMIFLNHLTCTKRPKIRVFSVCVASVSNWEIDRVGTMSAPEPVPRP